MDFFKALSLINYGFTLFVVFPAILLLGLYLTVKLGFVQFTKLKESFKEMLPSENKGDGITHYQAVAGVLAGNFGTGNISGMAIAMSTGGPGSLVWMWVISFLGASVQYASCILGIKYRQKNSRGEPVGGPMYYLDNGLGFKRLGAIFAIFTALGALAAGNFTQVNSMVLPLKTMGISPGISGIVIAILVGVVLLGGIKRFAKMAASVVPVMGIIYFGTALVILIMNINQVLPALGQMFKAAFIPTSFVGGSLGYGVMRSLTTGFDRGIFATDAGTGVAPILQSSTDSDDAVTNGVVTLIAPVFVMILCTMTGLVLMITGAVDTALQSTNMVTHAFSFGLGSELGKSIVTLALLLFSYTTILAWACCGERAIEYLMGDHWIKRFRIFFILMIPLGAFFKVEQVWLLSDLSFSLMLSINMIGIAMLSKEVIKDSKVYFYGRSN